MWHAKLKYGYAIDSAECIDNILEIAAILQGYGFSLECIAGMCGNFQAESAMNPWRWQNETVDQSNLGYGLAQITPADNYISNGRGLTGYGPSLSVDYVTQGAKPEDGQAQTIFIGTNALYKWYDGIWRSYWPDLPQLKQQVYDAIKKYNVSMPTRTRLSYNDYKNVDDLYDATLLFLGGYEGPAYPNIDIRYQFAQTIYEYLGGIVPISTKKLNWIYYLKHKI